MKSFQDPTQTPLLVGVDQEVGLVSRPHSGLVQQNGNQICLSKKNNTKKVGMKEVDDAGKECHSFTKLGITGIMRRTLTIVLSQEHFMWDRTFGQGYQQTVDYLSKVVPAWQHDNLVASH